MDTMDLKGNYDSLIYASKIHSEFSDELAGFILDPQEVGPRFPGRQVYYPAQRKVRGGGFLLCRFGAQRKGAADGE